MDIKFLGTGGYSDIDLGNSSALLNLGGKNILIDCGIDVYSKLVKKNQIETIDYVLLTHLHGDHMGSLFHLIWHRSTKKIKMIYYSLEHKKYLSDFFMFWRGTTLAIEERLEWLYVKEIPGIEYIDTYGQHNPGVSTYAFYFQEGNHGIYYSGDLGVIDVSINFLKMINDNVSLQVLHEVGLGKPNRDHCHYLELQEKLIDYDVYCYHCDHTQKPDDCTLKFVAEYSEFMF